MPAENPLGSRLKRPLLADERCKAVLVFLATTDVGRTSGPPVSEERVVADNGGAFLFVTLCFSLDFVCLSVREREVPLNNPPIKVLYVMTKYGRIHL